MDDREGDVEALMGENAALVAEVRRLRRELAKLEAEVFWRKGGGLRGKARAVLAENECMTLVLVIEG